MSGHDGHTIALPVCNEHPPLQFWGPKALALCRCPICGQTVDGEKVARWLRARDLIRELEGGENE